MLVRAVSVACGCVLSAGGRARRAKITHVALPRARVRGRPLLKLSTGHGGRPRQVTLFAQQHDARRLLRQFSTVVSPGRARRHRASAPIITKSRSAVIARRRGD